MGILIIVIIHAESTKKKPKTELFNWSLVFSLSFHASKITLSLLTSLSINFKCIYTRQEKITLHFHIDCSYMPVEQTESNMKYGPNPVFFIHLKETHYDAHRFDN